MDATTRQIPPTDSPNLDADACYRAVQSRDARFDGQFFTAVHTTGIYCRPICPAPTPKAENITFYVSAAAAQEAGFRPCLRCHPELAPHLWNMADPSGVVARAVRLIEEGALEEAQISQLADRLGVTERHLRRLCRQTLGASPVAIAQTRRLLLAKQLLDQTALPITDVALAAGFKSIRRFNTVMLNTFGRPPRELRKQDEEKAKAKHDAESGPQPITLKLGYSPPYDWPSLYGFLAQRTLPGIEIAEGDLFRRAVRLPDAEGGPAIVCGVEVRHRPKEHALYVTLWTPKVTVIGRLVDLVRQVFDLGANASKIAAHLSTDETLAPLVAKYAGLRVPGAWDVFEYAVRAILGQQISVQAARTLAVRVLEHYGQAIDPALTAAVPGLTRLFPTPLDLVEADLTALGVVKARATAINKLAAALVADPHLFSQYRDLEDAVDRLCQLPGIGPWTAHYLAMRGMHEPDAFPAADLGILRAYEKLAGKTSAKQLTEIANAWRPWRAYAAMYLWQEA
jgi:AraC family transcriptional regulator, regulatory protein of adaptative response / DNA-3-methyladenine glycosylase II